MTGDGAALLDGIRLRPAKSRPKCFDLDLKTRGGKIVAGAAVPQGGVRRRRHRRALAHARAQPRARRASRTRSAPPKCASCASSTTRRWRSRPSTVRAHRALQCAVRASCSRRLVPEGGERLDPAPCRRARPRALEHGDRAGAPGAGRYRAGRCDLARTGPKSVRRSFFVTAIDERTSAITEAAIVYALETTEQRALEQPVRTSRKRWKSVGQLAGGIAHDFNNVLSAIMMATDFLLSAHKPTDPSFQDIMQIKQNANRAARFGAAVAGVLAAADAAAAGARSRRGAVRSRRCCCAA